LALRAAVGSVREGEALSIGRDGASDAISFLEAGIPAVEFGPEGGGHHGPNEWVSVSSLKCYRQALAVFIRDLPGYLGKSGAPPKLRAVEG
jgi:succinyl-diaminopimelate desuccinylase